MQRISTAVLASALVLSFASFHGSLARADEPQAGFQLEELPYPLQSATATLSSGAVVAFDGQHVDLYDAGGALLFHLGTLASPTFPSFVLVSPSEDAVVLGESSNGVIYELGLTPGAPNPIATLPLNYDAVFQDEDHVIVSAATGGFGSGNRIYRLTRSTKSAALIAQIEGASGPVALDRSGGLLYGVVSATFPAPPGSSRVVRWSAAQLALGTLLGEGDATLVETGFDGATDMVVDPVGGGIYLAENNFGTGTSRIRLVAGNPLIDPTLVDGTAFQTISNLEFGPGDGVALFAGYQPARGGTLLYDTTDFVASFARRALTSLRPTAALAGAGTTGAGPFDVQVSAAPPGGFGFVFYGPSAQVPASEIALSLRVPLFLGLGPTTVARAPGTLVVGGAGQGALTYVSPGGLQGNWAVQVVLLDAAGKLAGSSTTAFF